MNGLECSEIMLSNIDKIQYRFDAEFYRPYYINMLLQIESKISKKISSMTIEVNCSAFYPSVTDIYDFNGNGIPFIRVNEIQKSLVNITENTAFLPQDFLLNNSNTIDIVKPMDIVIAKSGNTLAKVGLVGYEYKEYATSRDIVTVHTSNVEENVIYILWAYLSSKYGQAVLWRSASQTGQPHLTLKNILDVDMPAISESIGNNIKLLYERSRQKVFNANKLYKEAEQILLKALNMDNFVPSQQNTTTKSLSQFMNAGRLDAEYFQPKYDELQEILNLQISSPKLDRITTLESVVNIFKSIEPGSAEYCASGVPFVRVSDVSKYGISAPSIYLDKKSWGNIGLQPKKDTILFSKDGSVGIAYKVDKNIEYITSSALLHLTVRDTNVLPDYLTLVLNSLIVKMQSERDVGGSIIQHWRIDDIKKVVIPILTMDIQREIADKVQKSFELREKGNELLEAAKRAVEIAIEEDESTALAYLDKFCLN